MRRFGTLLFMTIVATLTVNGQEESGRVRTSRELVEQFLENRGIQVGCDAERGRMVAIGTSGFNMKEEASDEDWGLKETYDFPNEAGDDYETRRFKAVWKAYADGLARIASDLLSSVEHAETKAEDGKILSRSFKSSAVQSLAGVVTITMAESCTADGEYEVTVAVCQSQKRAEAYSRGLNGGDAKPGEYALDEWVKQKSESGLGMICPQSYCDNEGVWWHVAGVPVDLSAGRNSTKVAALTEKAKRYACEAAMRTIAVRVSTSSSTSISIDSSESGKKKERMERSVKIEPMNGTPPVGPWQVRWFELDSRDPFTGNPVRCVVAALRSGARKSEEKITPVLPEKKEVRESASLGMSTSPRCASGVSGAVVAQSNGGRADLEWQERGGDFSQWEGFALRRNRYEIFAMHLTISAQNGRIKA